MLKVVAVYTLWVFVLTGCNAQLQQPNIKSSAPENVGAEKIKTTHSQVLKPTTNQVVNFSKDHSTLDRASTHLEAPFNLALRSVENYIREWLLRPTEVEPAVLNAPEKPILPKAPILNKGEFETTKQFGTRLKQAKVKYNEALNQVKQDYIGKVDAYNSAIKFYNSEIEWEMKRRQEQVISMRTRLLNTAVNKVLGTPTLVGVKYNADKEIFNAKVVAQDNVVSYDIVIPIAINDAKTFKQNINNATVAIKMNLDGKIKPISFRIDNSQGSHVAYLADNHKIGALTDQRSAGVENIDLNNIVIDKIDTLNVDSIIDQNEQYFGRLF